jgi:DNA helicase II / ATP-dependent DNA helicase PcrA
MHYGISITSIFGRPLSLLEFLRKKHLEQGGSTLQEGESSDFLETVLSSQRSRVNELDASTLHVDPDTGMPAPEAYEQPEFDSVTDEKVTALIRVSDNIESRVVTSVEAGLFDGFKVHYSADLNQAQLAAVVTTDAPLLVIAGAGSGKTRVITYKVSYLIERGIPPHQILLLTFTRKAAREMMVRVSGLLKSGVGEQVTGGTFHRFAVQMLRANAAHIGINPNFTILDSDDSADTIDLVKAGMQIESSGRVFPKKGRIQELISSSRNNNRTLAKTIELDFPGLEHFLPDLERIALGFMRYKAEAGLLDYDDLLEVLRDALTALPELRTKLQNRFRYIMVDEYQDTNLVQKELVDLLVANDNITVVGDDSQSIYAFRGANFENILRFPETYPNCKVVKIEQNYRSNQPILNFTNAVINKAVLGYRKRLFSDHPSSILPQVKRFFQGEDEAAWIVDRIVENHAKGVALDTMSVLVRALWHSNLVQAELLSRGIPYVVVGGIKFNEKRHVKDIIAHLRLAVNPMDAVAWMRVLKLLSGIGQGTAKKLITHLANQNGVVTFKPFSNNAYYGQLERLERLFMELRRERVSVTEAVNIAIDYYVPILRSLDDDADIRLQDLKMLSQLATKYRSLESFLTDFALDPPSDKYQERTLPLIDSSEEKPVVVSTVHSAKGLEWYAVFIPFALDGLFPSVRAMKHIETLEEERRLFYVACSRAKEQLTITLPSTVRSWDKVYSYPSRFLADLPKEVFTVS